MDASLQTQAEQLASKLANQAETVEDLNSLMRLMIKSAMERMLDTDMNVHLGRQLPSDSSVASSEPSQPTGKSEGSEKRKRNRRNGRPSKKVQCELGEIPLETPRNGSFDPQLISKHQRRLPGFDEKILASYAKGMTTRNRCH